MATSNNPLICYILAAVAIAVAAASHDSSQGAALRGAAAVDVTDARRVQEVQGGSQPMQAEGAMQGGAVQGGAVHGGAMQGDAMQGGAVQGGAVQGGAVQGDGMNPQIPDLKVPDFL